ncbi:hypothetical protein HAX54_026689 [Datura stramonium]|uniref:Uncharacterized protein n=1 Tax=Datura stramonium TaxID=4076 RepID=A0ABS8V3L0_DATST|nr:hypothetical protein [Datura stramonium]
MSSISLAFQTLRRYWWINTGRSTMMPMNNAQSEIQFPHRSPPLDDAPQNLHRRPTFIGKRSLADFQQQQQFQFLQQQQHQQQVQQGLGFYLRNVKPRSYQQASPIISLSPVDFSASSSSISTVATRHTLPILQTLRSQPVISTANTNGVGKPNCSAVVFTKSVQNSLYQESGEMMNRLQELEKQLRRQQ